MKLAISNIAWHTHEEKKIANILRDYKVEGVEIAPTKIWTSPLETSNEEIKNYRDFWENHGIKIVSMQALLFGKPELTIFSTSKTREKTFNHLEGMIKLAAKLGAKVLVFGSPRNRRKEKLSQNEAEDIAIPFFRNLGRVANEKGVNFCIEPNPAKYNCDFITNAIDGLEFVKKVDQPGFGLHLDAAGMTIEKDPLEEIFLQTSNWWHHFHISEPFLSQIGKGEVNHDAFATALKKSSYPNWLSIEMKTQNDNFCEENVKAAIEYSLEKYFK